MIPHPLRNRQEQPLINDWQTWGYKCSHLFPLMEQRWAVTQPLFKSPLLCVTSLPGPLFFPAPLPNSPSDFSWEHSLMRHFPMDIPCLRICFQGKQKWKTTNSVIIRMIIIIYYCYYNHTFLTTFWWASGKPQLKSRMHYRLVWFQTCLLSLSYLNFLLCKTCKITSLSLSRIWSASFYMGVGWGPDTQRSGAGQCFGV